MELQRYSDVAAFYQQAEPFLLAHEATHCLLIGLCNAYLAQPETIPDDLYLACVTEGDELIVSAMRTPPNNLILSLLPEEDHMAEAMALLAHDALAVYGDALPGVIAPSAVSRAFAQQWRQVTGIAYRPGTKERTYQLDTVIPVVGVAGELRRATEADRALLERWLDAFYDEAFLPTEPRPVASEWVDRLFASSTRSMYFWVVDGEPVTQVGYTGPTPHGMRIGPVYTPPERRRHGYASAATAAVSQMLLDSGRDFCFLFTDLANPTSNAIYQQIGYRPVCNIDVYEFDAKE